MNDGTHTQKQSPRYTVYSYLVGLVDAALVPVLPVAHFPSGLRLPCYNVLTRTLLSCLPA
jgi:hypothetical protein